jgi:predicted esterase
MQRIILLALSFIIYQVKAQGIRYLNEVFDSVEVISNVSYGNAVNASGQMQNLKLDIYLPKNDTASRRPLIIWMHGGSFISGSKDNPEIVPFAQRFAKRGFVCASVQYRLGLDGFPPNQQIVLRSVIRAVQDGKGAVRFLRANASSYGIDTSHIFFGGSSAGAITALHIGYLNSLEEFQIEADSSLIIGLGGLEGGNDAAPGYSSKIHGVINLCGAIGEKVWIVPGDIPVASVHGDQDAIVPYKSAEIKFQGLPLGLVVDGSYVIDSFANAIGVQSALKTFYGHGHVPYVNNLNSAIYLDSTINFLAPQVYSWLGLSTSKSLAYHSIGNVFPNPAKQVLNVQTLSYGKYQVKIMNLQGQTVYEQNVQGNLFSLDVSELPKGLYFLNLQSDEFSQNFKFMKE